MNRPERVILQRICTYCLGIFVFLQNLKFECFKNILLGIQSSISSLSNAKQDEWVSSFPLVKSIPQPAAYVDKPVLALNKIHLKPFEKSVLWGKSHLLADTGYFMGRSFRAGWRSDGYLVTVQPPGVSDAYTESKFLVLYF